MPYKQKTLKNGKIQILQMENMEWQKVGFYDCANFKSIMLKRFLKPTALPRELWIFGNVVYNVF